MRIEKRIKADTGEELGIKYVRERWQDWLYFRVLWEYVEDGLPLPWDYFQTYNDRQMRLYEYWVWYAWPVGKILSWFKYL